MIDYTAVKFWFDVSQAAGTIAIGVYLWWDRRTSNNNQRFKSLEESRSDHARQLVTISANQEKRGADCEKRLIRITTLEKDIAQVPSRAELNELTNNIVTLTKEIGVLGGRLGGINRAVDLLNQHHLRAE